MIDRLKHLLAPPTFENEEDNRIAGILNVSLLTLFASSAILTLAQMILFGEGLSPSMMAMVAALFVIAVCYRLLRRGHLRTSSFVILLMMVVIVFVILTVGFGVHDPTILMLPIIIIMAGLMMDTWLFVLFTGLTVLSVGLVILLEVNGFVERAIFTEDSKTLEFLLYAIFLVITAVTVRLLSQSLKDNLARARKSEARLKSLVKNAPDLIFYLQQDGTIEFLNTVMDQPDNVVVGHTVYDFTHPDYHEQVRHAIDQVLQTGEPASYEALGISQSGNPDWFASRLGPVKQDGTITGLTMIATNINNRREMELALERERDFAQRIINNMGQGLNITDENGRYVYVNPAFTSMTGYTLAELVGKTPFDTALPEMMPLLKEQSLARRAGQTTTYTSHIRHADGHTVHVFVTGVPRWQEGKFIGSIAVVTDLTEQIEAEMERERLFAELEAQNAELERFTYTVSHDLKSPLITIRGFLGVLAQDLAKGDEVGVQAAIQYIDTAAKTMEILLRDLLELSRVGRVINPPEAVPFAEIVQEALLSVSGQLEMQEVDVIVADSLPVVFVDRVRLVEVVQNLLDNALKFRQDHAKMIIEVGAVPQNGETCFFVRDNGIGIAPQYHEKVFGLFERLDDSIEGTGIGLALVKRIIEVHNGRLWLESAGEGQGATFYFTLPLAAAAGGSGS